MYSLIRWPVQQIGTTLPKQRIIFVAPAAGGSATNANAEVVTFTITAHDPGISASTGSEVGSFTVTANDATINIKPNAENAPFTITVGDLTATVTSTPAGADFTFTANDATVTVGTFVNAEGVTLTITANDSTTKVSPGSEVVSFTVTPDNANTAVTAPIQGVDVTINANDSQTKVSPTAENVIVAITSDNAAPAVAVASQGVDVTVTTNNPSTTVAPVSENVLVVFTANDATVQTGSFINALAEVVTLTITAQDTTSKVSLGSEHSSLAIGGNDPAASIIPSVQLVAFTAQPDNSSGSVGASAGAVVVTTAPDDGKILISPRVEVASLVIEGFDVTAKAPIIIEITNFIINRITGDSHVTRSDSNFIIIKRED